MTRAFLIVNKSIRGIKNYKVDTINKITNKVLEELQDKGIKFMAHYENESTVYLMKGGMPYLSTFPNTLASKSGIVYDYLFVDNRYRVKSIETTSELTKDLEKALAREEYDRVLKFLVKEDAEKLALASSIVIVVGNMDSDKVIENIMNKHFDSKFFINITKDYKVLYYYLGEEIPKEVFYKGVLNE